MTIEEREGILRGRRRLGAFTWGGGPADLDGPGGSAAERRFHRAAAARTVGLRKRVARWEALARAVEGVVR